MKFMDQLPPAQSYQNRERGRKRKSIKRKKDRERKGERERERMDKEMGKREEIRIEREH